MSQAVDVPLDARREKNPIRANEITDGERADLLRDYLDAIDDICPNPRLMPLDEDGKQPAIVGQYRLGSEGSKALLHTPDEAIEAIRDGAKGFALYAGNPDHGTEDLVFVDHDDIDTFPLETLPETLTVMSGSGGYHETFVNAGNVRNAQGTDDMEGAGEIRAENWYVVLPGSVHPSGGIYHVTEDRPIAELCSDDIPDGLQPSTSSYDGSDPVEIRRDPDRDETEYINGKGLSLDEVRDYDSKLDSLLSTDYPDWIDHNDDSRIDATLVWRLRYHHFEPSEIADIWQQYRWRDKLERDDYIQRTIQNCASHDTRARYNRQSIEIDVEAALSSIPSFEARDRTDDTTDLSLSEARSRCQDRIIRAIEHGDHVLIDGLPTIGKSRGLIEAIAEVDAALTVFTARHDLYEQYIRWCQENGLEYYTLPSFHRDCPTARGDFDDDEDDAEEGWSDKVLSLYQNGVLPKEIHAYAERQFGRPLPCNQGSGCTYTSRWNFEPSDYDVLIGHYTHAYNEEVTTDRVVAFDESPTDAFLTEYESDNISEIVSTYLGQHEGVPFDDYTELIEHRADDDRRRDACAWLEDIGVKRDVDTVLDSDGDNAHTSAPILTYALLVGDDLGNGWEYCPIDESGQGKRIAAWSRETSEIALLIPPSLNDVDSLIGLDGTPTPSIWRLTIGLDLEHRQVLDDAERSTYLSDVLGLRITQTTDAIKPYSSGAYVKEDQDRALFEWVRSNEGRKPALISTKKALNKYRKEGALGSVGETKHYGNLKGSNDFKKKRVGIVAGSRHFSDDYIEKWGALAGESVERGEGKGTDLTYGPFGNALLRNMREHETFQALMRFGRDGDGANVYVHTAAIPKWVPIDEQIKVTKWSPGMKEVISALLDSEQHEWETSDVKSDDHVSISTRQVRTHLSRLVEYGYLDREREGRGVLWIDAALDDINEHGVVFILDE